MPRPGNKVRRARRPRAGAFGRHQEPARRGGAMAGSGAEGATNPRHRDYRQSVECEPAPSSSRVRRGDENGRSWRLSGRGGRSASAVQAAVAKEPAIDLFAPERVDDFAADGFGVRAHLEGGATLQGRLLVAADGKRSKLRARAGIKSIGWSYPQVGIVATVAHEHPHQGRAVRRSSRPVPSPSCRSPAIARLSSGPKPRRAAVNSWPHPSPSSSPS